MADTPRVIIVGGGLAGLAAAVRVAEAGVAVDLFSMVPVKRTYEQLHLPVSFWSSTILLVLMSVLLQRAR